MNILINYDYINAVKDVNEEFSLKKVARNNKIRWLKINLPFYFGLDFLIYQGDLKRSLVMLLIQFGIITSADFIGYTATKRDIYKIRSETNLKKLVSQFKDASIDTSYELLKQSELYDKKYEIKLNEKKFPQLIQSKYILVPTYDNIGDVKETSVVQEHIMGSKEYVLSLGKAKKVLKPALSSI